MTQIFMVFVTEIFSPHNLSLSSGFSNQKDYHHLYLNSSALSLATTGSVYLGFYQSFATSFDSPLEYKISMTYASKRTTVRHSLMFFNRGCCPLSL